MLRKLNRLLLAAALSAGAIFAHSGAMAQSKPQKLVVGLLPGKSAPTVMRLNEPLRPTSKSGWACQSNLWLAPTTPRRAKSGATVGESSWC